MSSFPAARLSQLYKWVSTEEEMRQQGKRKAYFKRMWDGLGYGTGKEEQDGPGPDADASPAPVGTRGGRFPWRKEGTAVAGVFADGEQQRAAYGDGSLEGVTGTAVDDSESADPDFRSWKELSQASSRRALENLDE